MKSIRKFFESIRVGICLALLIALVLVLKPIVWLVGEPDDCGDAP